MGALDGRTAIVTGASYGLGVTFAEALAGAGANVVIAARSGDRLEVVAKELEANGASVLVHPCDVSSSASVESLVDNAWTTFGRVDVLVNNAGVSAEAGVMPEKIPDELFQQTIAVNLTGLYFCCRAVGQRQLADGKGGSIVNIASVLGLGGGQNMPAAYQAAKAGVINLTRNLAVSWAERGVRVNALAPGWFPSEMTGAWFAVPEFLARFEAQAPMGRVGRVEELVEPLLFLAGDGSSFVTGQTLAVDGGLSAAMGAWPYSDELWAMQAAAVGELGEPIRPA
jgi:NAD(P)-dependent dehydrogenase (short-subunit alcohol dehydrogenase family)